MSFSAKALFRKFLLTLANNKLYKKLINQTKIPAATQEELFKTIIANNKNTAFGRDHNFDKINSYKDFVKNVPIRDFEGHRSYIEKMMNGEENILFPGKPLM